MLQLLTGDFLIYTLSTFAFVGASTALGLKIILKYLCGEGKRVHLYLGAAWVFISSPWWGSAYNSATALAGGEVNLWLYSFAASFFMPFFIFGWTAAYLELMDLPRRLPLLAFGAGIAAYEAFSLALLSVNPDLIATFTVLESGLVDHKLGAVSAVFQLGSLFFFVGTGGHFAYSSFARGIKPRENSLMLFGAFLSFLVFALFDAVIPMSETTLLVVRGGLIGSGVLYYFGFFYKGTGRA
jgi:hypothetical protein